jgi:ferredoxin-nitrate reductase
LNRQLDALGSQLLHEEMADQGCDIYYDDEVQLFYGTIKTNRRCFKKRA